MFMQQEWKHNIVSGMSRDSQFSMLSNCKVTWRKISSTLLRQNSSWRQWNFTVKQILTHGYSKSSWFPEHIVIWSFSLAAHKCWWAWKTFLSKENDQIITIKSCYFSAGYHYSIWYFKTRPWTCTTIPHLSNTHHHLKTKFRATQGRSRAITAVRSMAMFRVERMNTWGKQRKQQNYLAQTHRAFLTGTA